MQGITQFDLRVMNFIGKRTSLPSLETVASVLWCIWVTCNNAIFRGHVSNAGNTIESAKVFQGNYERWAIQASQARKDADLFVSHTWVAPVNGELKINVDGSLAEGTTDGVVACVCRDYTGNLVAGFTKTIQASSAAQVETLTLLEALRFVKKKGLSKISIQPDRQDLIQVLKSTDHFNWEFRLLISECSSILASLPSVWLEFGPRSTNMVAD